jgi:tetratricopeptide (TPR) repeat protein
MRKLNYIALTNRGIIKSMLGDHQSAINDFSYAIQINPDNHLAFFNRGNTKFILFNDII